MADFDSSLPIRTENDGDVVAIISDATITSQKLKVNADGSINITDNSGSITVDGSVTVSASDLDIRDLSHSQDSVKVGDGTDFLAIAADGSIAVTDNGTTLSVDDGGGSITVDGSVTVSASDLDIRDLSHTQDSVKIGDGTDFLAVAADGSIAVTDNGSTLSIDDGGGSITVDGSVTVSGTVTVTATDLDIRDLSHTQDSVKVGDGTDFLAVNADGSVNITDNGGSITVDGSVTVSATDLDIRDLTAASDSVEAWLVDEAGNAFTSINPLPVQITSGGTPIVDYDTSASIAGGASDTHTYTSTGNFYLTQIEASGSGKLKIEVQVNSVTKFVQFNSTSNPNMTIQLSQPVLATTGQTVTVIRTNRDNQAQDVYSTISGYNA